MHYSSQPVFHGVGWCCVVEVRFTSLFFWGGGQTFCTDKLWSAKASACLNLLNVA